MAEALKSFGKINNSSLLTKLRKKMFIPNSTIPSFCYPFRTFEIHVSADRIKCHLPKQIWESYYKFAFIRNPFDWQVSHYYYILQDKNHPYHEEVSACKNFKEYVTKICTEKFIFRPNPLTRFLCDDNNVLLVDYVGRFEQLNDDFIKICENIGINTKLPHKKKSEHSKYIEYYDTELRNVVEKHHNLDLLNFNYSF